LKNFILNMSYQFLIKPIAIWALWNYLAPFIGLRLMSYPQAVALTILISLLMNQIDFGISIPEED
jgi:hypothetical protein